MDATTTTSRKAEAEAETASFDSTSTTGKSISWQFGSGLWMVRFNPVITFTSILLIWGFVAWAMISCAGIEEGGECPANQYLSAAKAWITATFTWLYMGTQAVWVFFLLYIYFSKYGDIKLGKDDEKPEFSTVSWFSMLFCCGVGVGMFYFGVAEPIFHYEPCYGNPFAGAVRHNADGSVVPGTGQCHGSRWAEMEDNERAQWSMLITLFHWGLHGYVVYAIVGLLLGLLCYRFGLPLAMKSAFYPLIGEHIFGPVGDFVDIISIICTIFGVCTSLGLGVMQLNQGLARYEPNFPGTLQNNVIVLWVITVISLASCVSGLKAGIKFLSQFCFLLGNLLLVVVMFSDNTWYLLNLYTQSVGVYFQWILKLGSWSDAFEQEAKSSPDGTGAPQGWMNSWTIFYWGWWIAFCPFVGLFIAKISRGRTIRQVLNGTMSAPVLYTFFWFSIFGGAGLRMEREAARNGVDCSTEFPAVPGPDDYVRLTCRGTNDMWFDVMDHYAGVGRFLSGVSLVALTIYFITTSDSGSLVVDSISDNGSQETTTLTRVFWSLTEGATATALLVAGGEKALSALQTGSIVTGLLFTIIVCYMCASMWWVCAYDKGDVRQYPWQQWKHGLTTLFYRPTWGMLSTFLVYLVNPVGAFSPIAHRTQSRLTANLCLIGLAATFYGCFALLIIQAAAGVPNLHTIAWAIMCCTGLFGAVWRAKVREFYGIGGDMVSDYFAMFVYPCAAMQLRDQLTLPLPKKSDDDEDGSPSDETTDMKAV
ncbi:unnamed protein product [Vitrella brassicaformis CCMP3155]|uniref:Uncharacterized protein n=2 Tax=Vitrella brassicaformis TaxID=1169539 RepID=A0A0G4FRQ4_VITBC|nr:unnamed protein product [Vitrella brassicaformis CCMP3155]|eukprot:CEM17339.1 unnamed protein product [Vitrella brassicaformis CCMP3155]